MTSFVKALGVVSTGVALALTLQVVIEYVVLVVIRSIRIF